MARKLPEGAAHPAFKEQELAALAEKQRRISRRPVNRQNRLKKDTATVHQTSATPKRSVGRPSGASKRAAAAGSRKSAPSRKSSTTKQPRHATPAANNLIIVEDRAIIENFGQALIDIGQLWVAKSSELTGPQLRSVLEVAFPSEVLSPQSRRKGSEKGEAEAKGIHEVAKLMLAPMEIVVGDISIGELSGANLTT